jgi:RND family efflux transporter MFP subunit
METENPVRANPVGAPLTREGTREAQPVRAPAAPAARPGRWKSRILVLAVVLVVAGGVYFLFVKPAGGKLEAGGQNIVTVGAAKVVRQDLYNEVPIPAEFRPYVQSQLHAMVTGYVSKMYVDFGDRVKQGQILAKLEVPELQDQLHNAMATEQQAEADYANEHLIYARLQQVDKEHPKLVAQQDLDTARSKDANSAAAVAAAKANIEKYQTLVNYTNIVAPFDGIITQRSADPGALVQAGTSSDSSMALVQVSDNYRLRLDFPVSVEYVQDVHIGDPVTVRVDSLGGKTFTGQITRAKDEVNAQTRTMMTEIELENPNLEIVPGMYAVVLFKYARRPDALAIPTEAISDPKSPTVYLIGSDHKIEARTVTLGVEMPDKFQVTNGLQEGDLVMIGNRSQVHPGQPVDVKVVGQPKLDLPPQADGEASSSEPEHSTPMPLDPRAATSTPPSTIPDKP